MIEEQLWILHTRADPTISTPNFDNDVIASVVRLQLEKETLARREEQQ
jgi:hypothetical protein